VEFLNERLDLAIKPTEFKGDLHLSPAEKSWYSQVHELTGEDTPFWLIVAGGKFDITIKWWSTARYQEVVDHFRGRIQFVQVGERSHHHPRLDGVIDLRGQTDLRQLVRLVHHAEGIVCSVTALMHLAAAVETRPGRARHRPCVVVAGGREPPHWEAYPFHQFIHTVGALSCCATGGCWRARTKPLGDGDTRDQPGSLCLDVAGDLPRCMDMISAAEVCRRIELYFAGGQAQYLTPPQATAGERGVTRSRAASTFDKFVRPANARRESTVLIQSACGVHARMLDLTGSWHQAYATRHGHTLWSLRGTLQTERPPHWDKILLIQRALQLGFDRVIWLDADTLIVKPEVDLRTALPDGPPIGMCRHPTPFGEQPWHYNSGVMFIRNTPLAREFFGRVWATGPNDSPWQEQVGINRLSQEFPEAVQVLPDRWNRTLSVTEAEDPVLMAWHGYRRTALPLMREALEKCLQAQEQEPPAKESFADDALLARI
jgi:hypothetical protein